MSSGFHLMRFFSLFALLLFITSAQASLDSTPAWKEAMTAYKAADYQTALTAFKKIAADEQQISAALCHNIANCEYKLGEASGSNADEPEGRAHDAAAGLWYRRALALDPWLPEARQNLRFLFKKTGYHKFEDYGLVEFASWFPRRTWVAACQGGIWAAAIVLVWLVWLTPRPGRRWPLVTLLCLAAAFIVMTALGLIGKAMDGTPLAKRLISITGEKEFFARNAPAEAAATVIQLPPGSELLPIKEEGYWTYCQIAGTEKSAPVRGWVRTDKTERLWPWNATLIE
jgi:hypothetical protein